MCEPTHCNAVQLCVGPLVWVHGCAGQLWVCECVSAAPMSAPTLSVSHVGPRETLRNKHWLLW